MNHESAATYSAFQRINHPFSAEKQSFEQNLTHSDAYRARKITATLQQNSLTKTRVSLHSAQRNLSPPHRALRSLTNDTNQYLPAKRYPSVSVGRKAMLVEKQETYS